VFCVPEMIQLYSVVLYIITVVYKFDFRLLVSDTVVYKFDFRLVVSESRNKRRPELVKSTTSRLMTNVCLPKHVTE
jgi:hypothetical protein